MKLVSPAFENDQRIPQKYGAVFENVNPPLWIEEAPQGTASFALALDDPDVPEQAGVPVWDHWVVYDIPPETHDIPEGWTPTGTRGAGTRGKLDYTGPQPPDREHRYIFTLYALDATLGLPEGATKQQLLDAMQGHVLSTATLVGRFAP